MGKLKGVLPVTGTFGNLSLIETKDGIVVKTKSSVPRHELLEGKQFERSRENSREFAAAAKACKAIRYALKGGIFIEPDKGLMNRINARLMKITQSDTTHVRGQRRWSSGMVGMLRQLEINNGSRFSDKFFPEPDITINKDTGMVTTSFETFQSGCVTDPPEKASHFRLAMVAMRIPDDNMHWQRMVSYSDYFPCNHSEVPAFQLTASLDPRGAEPVIVALAIEFYQYTSALYYPIEMGASNAMAIVKTL